jgi:hypothetical protein
MSPKLLSAQGADNRNHDQDLHINIHHRIDN